MAPFDWLRRLNCYFEIESAEMIKMKYDRELSVK